MDGSREGRLAGCMHGRLADAWLDGRLAGLMDVWMARWRDGCTNGG